MADFTLIVVASLRAGCGCVFLCVDIRLWWGKGDQKKKEKHLEGQQMSDNFHGV